MRIIFVSNLNRIFFIYTLKVLNFAVLYFVIFAKFCTRVKFQNHKIPKVNTREIKYLASLNSLVLNI